MDRNDLKLRTKQFTLRALKLVDALPKRNSGRMCADQLGRCASSVGANYRSACRGRSKAEFVAKLGIVEEEADEACFWMEVIIEHGLMSDARVAPLMREASELTAIMAASRITASRSIRKSTIGNRK
jgi:four helix bundle protein